MKNFIFLFLIIPAISRAQFFVDLGAGVASLADDKKISVLPMMQISAGYQAGNFVLTAEERPTTTRKINTANYFGGKAGVNIHGLVPAVGYYFNFRNSDNPENNSSGMGYSLKYQLAINERGGVFAEGMMINRSYQITAGVHIQF